MRAMEDGQPPPTSWLSSVREHTAFLFYAPDPMGSAPCREPKAMTQRWILAMMGLAVIMRLYVPLFAAECSHG
jgi:hypothetical protein